MTDINTAGNSNYQPNPFPNGNLPTDVEISRRSEGPSGGALVANASGQTNDWSSALDDFDIINVFSQGGDAFALLDDGTLVLLGAVAKEAVPNLARQFTKEVIKRGLQEGGSQIVTGATKRTIVRSAVQNSNIPTGKIIIYAAVFNEVLGINGGLSLNENEIIARIQINQSIAKEYEAQGYEVEYGGLGGVSDPDDVLEFLSDFLFPDTVESQQGVGITSVSVDGVELLTWNNETKQFDKNPLLLEPGEEDVSIEELAERAGQPEFRNEGSNPPSTEDSTPIEVGETVDLGGGVTATNTGDYTSLIKSGDLEATLAPNDEGLLTLSGGGTPLNVSRTADGTEFQDADGNAVTVLRNDDNELVDVAGDPSDEPWFLLRSGETGEEYVTTAEGFVAEDTTRTSKTQKMERDADGARRVTEEEITIETTTTPPPPPRPPRNIFQLAWDWFGDSSPENSDAFIKALTVVGLLTTGTGVLLGAGVVAYKFLGNSDKRDQTFDLIEQPTVKKQNEIFAEYDAAFDSFQKSDGISPAQNEFMKEIGALSDRQNEGLQDGAEIGLGEGRGVNDKGGLIKPAQDFYNSVGAALDANREFGDQIIRLEGKYASNMPDAFAERFGLDPLRMRENIPNPDFHEYGPNLEPKVLAKYEDGDISTAVRNFVAARNDEIMRDARPELLGIHYFVESNILGDGFDAGDLAVVIDKLDAGDEQPFRDLYKQRAAIFNADPANAENQIASELPAELPPVRTADGTTLFEIDDRTQQWTISIPAVNQDTIGPAERSERSSQPNAGNEEGESANLNARPGNLLAYALPSTVLPDAPEFDQFGVSGEAGSPDLWLNPDNPILTGDVGELFEPETVLSEQQQVFADTYDELIAEGADPEDARMDAYDAYLETNVEGLRDAYIDGAYGETTAAQVDRPTFETIVEESSAQFREQVRKAEYGSDEEKAVNRAILEANGVTFTEDGRVDRSEGSIMAQSFRRGGQDGRDPELTAHIQLMQADGASEAQINAVIAAFSSGDPIDEAFAPDEVPRFSESTGSEGAKNGAVAYLQERSQAAFEDDQDILGAFYSSVATTVAVAAPGTDVDFFNNILGATAPLLDEVFFDSESPVFANAAAEVREYFDEEGLLPTNGDYLELGAGAYIGSLIKGAGDAEGDLGVKAFGIAVEVGFELEIALSRQGEEGFDFGNAIKDIAVDALRDLTAGTDFAPFVELGALGYNVATGDLTFNGVATSFGNLLGGFIGGEEGEQVTKFVELGVNGYTLFTGLGGADAISKRLNQKLLEDIGLEALGNELAASGFYTTAGDVTSVASYIVDVLQFVGVDIPEEFDWAVTTTSLAFAGPGGWAMIAADTISRIFGGQSGVRTTTFQEGVDADADLLLDDNIEIETPWDNKNFFRKINIGDGNVQYAIDGVNPDFLEEATFTLTPWTERAVEFTAAHTEVEGRGTDRDETDFPDTLTIDAYDIEGTLTYPPELEIGATAVGVFNTSPDQIAALVDESILPAGATAIPIHITRGDDERFAGDDGESRMRPTYTYEVDNDWQAATLASSATISGSYLGINEMTGGETFDEVVAVRPEEFGSMQAGLGGLGPVTLSGDDPRFDIFDDPSTVLVNEAESPTVLGTIMSRVSVTFDETEERNPNYYQYMDVNGDGNADLVRYGIKQGDDGLDSGDERFEATLLDENRQPLGLRDPATGEILRDAEGAPVTPLPTIKADTPERLQEVGRLAPYLFAWAAARPEMGAIGNDPVSIFNAVEEAGQLETMLELWSADRARGIGKNASDIIAANRAQDPNWEPSPEEDAALKQQLADGRAGNNTSNQRSAELGLFDVAAYEATNPDLAEAYANSPNKMIELSWHYTSQGNPAGAWINPDQETLPASAQVAWPDKTYIGAELWPGQRMQKDEMLLSENGQFTAVFSEDGVLTTYDLSSNTPQELWSTKLNDRTDDGWVEIQPDGNVLIRDNDGDIGFSTHTYTQDGAASGAVALRLENDGNLVVRDRLDNSVLWAGGVDNDNYGYGNFIAHPLGLDQGADVEATASADLYRDMILFTESGARTYLASDPARVTAWQQEGGDPVFWAREHFLNEGQGGEVAMNYDVESYLAAPGNGDLAIAFRNDPDGATQHYLETGLSEVEDGNRDALTLGEDETANIAYIEGPVILDTELGALRYLASNPSLAADILASGEDPITQARNHFRAVGWSEDYGMRFDFNVQTYLSAPGNGDLAMTFAGDPEGAIWHLLETGTGEFEDGTRADLTLDSGDTPNIASQHRDAILNNDLDALEYIASNPGLARDVAEQHLDPILTARQHFEGRGWNPEVGMRFEFDAQSYIEAPGNGDLYMAFADDPEGAVRHYLETGSEEIAGGTRDNAQLQDGETQNLASLHHDDISGLNGTEEGAWNYLASNPELARRVMEAECDPVYAARQHFRDRGWNPDVGMRFDFDAESYLSAPENADLALAFGRDKAAATKHYVTIGRAEIESVTSTRVLARDPNIAQSNAYLFRDDIMTTEDGALRYLAANPELEQNIEERSLDPVSTARTHFEEVGWMPSYNMDFQNPELKPDEDL